MLVLEDKMEYGKNFKSAQFIEIMQDKTLSVEKLAYHLGLLVECGFLKAKEYKYISGEPTDYLINTITSQGQDFIDTIRQDTTWNKIKEKAYEIGGYSLPLLADIGFGILKDKIGI